MSSIPLTAKTLPIKTIGIVVLAILAFWFIDVPWTVRSKVLLMNVFPLDAKSIDDMTLSLCKNAYGRDWSTCYYANHNEEYRKAKMKSAEVQDLCNRVQKPTRKGEEFTCSERSNSKTILQTCTYDGEQKEGTRKIVLVNIYEDGCEFIFSDFTTLGDCGGGECPD